MTDEELLKRLKKLEKRVEAIEKFLESFQSFTADSYEAEDGLDELYEKALWLVIQCEFVSASFIQRRLQVGFNRAARMLEQLEENGIVGPAEGSKPREVLVKKEEMEDLLSKLKKTEEEKKKN